jgi:phosphoadenosine phosphosulfate reductase
MQILIGQSKTSLFKKLITSIDITKNLQKIAEAFPKEVVFTSSFSIEDQLITHIIFTSSIDIEVVTLDTGRLFPETYSTWSKTVERYLKPITPFYPENKVLEDFVAQKGPNSFYESIENRQRCCAIRKVEPLTRAIKDKKVWITGIRSAHSPDRNDMVSVEWDKTNQILKYHPLLDWSNEQVRGFIISNSVIYNPLQDKGFVSIGCAPCTRAIQPGEDFRAGRWWWEDASKKECGLHVHE